MDECEDCASGNHAPPSDLYGPDQCGCCRMPLAETVKAQREAADKARLNKMLGLD